MRIKPDRHLAIPSLVALLLAALWALAGYQAYEERGVVIAAKEVELNKLVVAVEEQTLRLFKLTEATVVSASHWIEDHPGAYPGQAPSFIELVSNLMQLSDGAIELRLIDAQGGVHLVPAPIRQPVANLADREHFRVQQDVQTQGIFIGDPLLSPVDGKWIVPVSYPIRGTSGQFSVVAASIQVDRIIQPFEAQRQKPHGSITLLKSNGVTLVRTPHIKESYGKSIANAPDFIEHLSAKERGLYRVKGAYDGVERIVGHARPASYPVIIAVTASMDDVLAPWWLQLGRIGMLMSLVTAAAIFFTCRFVRAERTARELLAHSAQRFRTLIEHAPDAILVFDVDTQHIIDVNPKAERLFERRRNELLSGGVKRFYTPIQPDGLTADESIRQAHTRAIRGESVLIERSIRTASGKELTVEARVDDMSEARRRLVRISFIDISERKRAEMALRESEAQLRLLVETSPLPMIVATPPPEGRLVMLNECFSKTFDYAAEDIPDLEAWWPLVYPDPAYRDEVRQRWDEALQRMVAAGRHSLDEPFAAELTCKDGTRRFVEIHISAQPDRCLVVFHDLTQRREYELQLARIAHYDGLTDLPNRRLFTDRMEQALARAMRNGKMLAVCYLDLDKFKPVNDQYGHKAGDRVLVEAAKRMVQSIRTEDTAARLGGDEFVLLLVDLESLAECERVVERVLSSLANLFELEQGISATLSSSIGVAMFPGGGKTPDELVRNADQAMYAAKQAGRNRTHFFVPQAHQKTGSD
jgi:diguanylate cyclase (GGDEF)-like protein/PAS domain S-box-containing protein